MSEQFNYHLFMDLDGTMVRRQPLEESFFKYYLKEDEEFIIDPVPDLHLKGFFHQNIAYLRPGVVEFLTWAMKKFEGRVYMFTASSKRTAEGFWKILRSKFPDLPELVVFGAEDCIDKWKRVPETSTFHQNVTVKELGTLVDKHRDFFPNYKTDRFLLIDDRPDFIDDEFTSKSSILVPPFSPIIKITNPNHPEHLTVLVSEFYYKDPSEDNWKTIREEKASKEDPEFFENLKRSILEKLPNLEPIPNPVDKEIELAKAELWKAIENGMRFIYSCSKNRELHIFYSEEAVKKFLRHRPTETFALLEITDEGELELIDSYRK